MSFWRGHVKNRRWPDAMARKKRKNGGHGKTRNKAADHGNGSNGGNGGNGGSHKSHAPPFRRPSLFVGKGKGFGQWETIPFREDDTID